MTAKIFDIECYIPKEEASGGFSKTSFSGWKVVCSENRTWQKNATDSDSKSPAFITCENDILHVDSSKMEISDVDNITLNNLEFTFTITKVPEIIVFKIIDLVNDGDTWASDIRNYSEKAFIINNDELECKNIYTKESAKNSLYFITQPKSTSYTNGKSFTFKFTNLGIQIVHVKKDATDSMTELKDIVDKLVPDINKKITVDSLDGLTVSELYEAIKKVKDYIDYGGDIKEVQNTLDCIFTKNSNIFKIATEPLYDAETGNLIQWFNGLFNTIKTRYCGIYDKYNGAVVQEEDLRFIHKFYNAVSGQDHEISIYDFDHIRGKLTETNASVSLQQIADVTYLVCNGIYIGGNKPPYYEKGETRGRKPEIDCAIWVPGDIANLYCDLNGDNRNSTGNDCKKLRWNSKTNSYYPENAEDTSFTIFYRAEE